ncbi:hypothetical protein OVA07_14370 [Novosphingobium sp. SL115]|uniref:hypothetical protein n=1 Tax=Novosphingobium sp. SL115 TaxID=2995150 RepID=UPI002275648E|nr:hypothetical protein [Novosphingobium sp. SL115]MCY1672188.1 hypothetical protein [Novosphingobium sp. SL115]
MHSILVRLTPGQIARFARIPALGSAFVLALGYVSNLLTPAAAVMIVFAMGWTMLLAAPRQRASEMLGAAAVWIAFAEFLSTIDTGHFQFWRLGVAVATLGGIMLVIRVQYLRELARTAPESTLAQLDRRSGHGIGMLPHSTAQLDAMRQQDAA